MDVQVACVNGMVSSGMVGSGTDDWAGVVDGVVVNEGDCVGWRDSQ